MRSALVPILLADPMPWAFKAPYAWDFLKDRARFAGGYRGGLANTPNWTLTRASTAYYTNSAGVLTSVASGVLRTGDRGALIEGAGTNLCLQSQTFDNASWTKTRSSISADATTAPDGTVTADKLVEDSSNNTHWTISNIITITADSTFTVSAYFKAGERTWVRLIGSDNTETNLFGAFFDIANGVLGTNQLAGTGAISSKSITPLANGWYRCAVTGSVGSGITSGRLQIKLGLADLTVAYAGDGASGLYLWGAQLEAAAFASSYIPTTTASATRAADSLTVTGVSGFGATLSGYHKIRRAADTGAVENYFQIDDGTDNNRIRMAVDASDRAELLVVAGGVTQAQIAITGAMAVNTEYGIAWRVGTNSAQICRSGTLGTEDTSVTVPTGLTTIRFGAGVSGANPANGNRAQDAIFTRSLSDAELQSIAAT